MKKTQSRISKKTSPKKVKKPVYARKSLGSVLFMTSEPEIRGIRQMMEAGMNVSKWKPKKKTFVQRLLHRLSW